MVRHTTYPPPSFQPQIAIPPPNTTATQTPSASTTTKVDGQDLISRYNLSSKLASENEPETSTIASSTSSWSQNKDERQRLLQKRRDEMILAARRKMMQKNQDSPQ
ncbi:hypothetical protein VI817_000473 [Penicillium citrinum]|nr:hypothetical protein VI817_000473 [Penicillium citrinum]